MMEISNPVYPWQKELWNQLSTTTASGRIAHALLFTGPKGVGKQQFALAFKNALLCSDNNAGELACGQCRFCKIPEHPDFHYVTFEVNEKTGKLYTSIHIDQIRNLIEFTSLHTHYGQAKVIVIHPAEAMTRNAANALLKILEEPPQDTYFVLLSDEIHHLSATIKSRCQLLKFTIPDSDISKQWLCDQGVDSNAADSYLKMAYNAPLTAKTLAESNYSEQYSKLMENLFSISNKTEDPMVIANSWLKIESDVPLQALYSCLSDLILLKMMRNNADITNRQNLALLQNIANNVSFKGLYVILDKIAIAKQQIRSNVALLGIYEDILNLWQRLTNSNAVQQG